jgi:GMP synthase-like glutamine amidotransferase
MNRRTSSLVIVQHHIAEGPGELTRWAGQRGIDVSLLRPDLDELPSLGGVPIVLLGGPYSVMDAPAWLQRERQWLRELVVKGTPVLGICLGAQLLADALGGAVFELPKSETGWTTVRFADGRNLDVLQWHDESFSLPRSAVLHASSMHCTNQYFTVGETQVGLQFHPEWNADSVSELIFFFGSACPPLRSGSSDTRRHHAVTSWFHERLDRWFESAANGAQLSA